MVLSGSSPRVRGTHSGLGGDRPISRFIPARAGNAGTVVNFSNPSPVHPRACGERGDLLLKAVALGGSSPRVRGTHDHDVCDFLCGRFIPARAGNASQ